MKKEMKDSGIPWIGEIPESWNVSKVKDAFVRKNEKAHQENPIVLSLARSGVKVRDISNNEGQIAESYFDYNPVDVDDLLINPMDLYSGANCSISKVKGVISPAYVNLRHKENVCPRYYDYYFKTQYWAMAFFAHGKGISFDNRWTLGIDTLFNYYIPSPSYEEQKAIADFLDKKCDEIDRMIAIQEKFIEELKAYKQSVITEAVTKGLNLNAPMKDSGIEWIGRIPEGWIVCKLKHVYTLLNGRAYSDSELLSEGKYKILRVGNLFTSDKWYFSNLELEDNKYCQNGDLLYGWSASIGPYLWNSEKVIFHYHIWKVIFSNNRQFAYYQLQALTEAKRRDMHGSAMQHLTMDGMNNSYIAVPPILEQENIATYLDEKCSEIDKLISIKQQKIEELKDYRKSLIYEYVTGKKQVIGYATNRNE